MSKAVKLILNGKHIGYRITSEGKRYDVELNVAHKLGLAIDGVTKRVELHDDSSTGLLLSKTEKDSGKYATDISGNHDLVKRLFGVLGEGVVAKPRKSRKPNVLV